jgi:hypothetical protein
LGNSFFVIDNIMPNYEVEIRRNQYDVAGLVLACPVTSVVLSGSNVTEWTNLAPAVQPGSTDPRFGNPIQATTANQPLLINTGGQDYVSFDISGSKYMDLPRNAGTWTGINEWTIALAGKKGTDNTNGQDILSLPNIEILRRNSSGNKAYVHGVTEQAGSGDYTDGASVITYKGATGGEWFTNGVSDFTGTCANVNPSADGAIGRDYTGATNYADFDMTGIYIWKRALEDTEIDFIFKHIDPIVDHSTLGWADIILTAWKDDTATPPRINPYTGADQKYYRVEVPTGTSELIQIACKVGGLVLPDTGLGGDLFTSGWLEYASTSPPVISRPTGWSSIFNITLADEGHYTFQTFRIDGGSVIVHFDVEEI